MNDDNLLMELGIKRESPFTVPDKYFDNLDERIMSNVLSCESNNKYSAIHKKKVIGKISKWTSIAAACALVVVLSAKHFTQKAPTMDTAVFTEEEMSTVDILNYSMLESADVYNYLNGAEY